MVRFELTNAEIKTRCLATWRHPICLHQNGISSLKKSATGSTTLLTGSAG